MNRQEALMHLLAKEANRIAMPDAMAGKAIELPLPLEWIQARTSLSQGSYEMAYNQLNRLRDGSLDTAKAEALQQDIFKCLEGIANLFLIECVDALRRDIINYRSQPDADNGRICHLCIQLIHFKYNNEGEIYSLQHLADDEFLLDCLANDFYPDPHIEQFLTDIRRKLLLSSVQEMEVNEACLPLFQSIALQGYLTNYVFFSQDDEQAVVNGLDEDLGNLLSGDECDLDDITNILLLLSMYKPLHQTNANPALEGILAEQLPEFLRAIFVLTYLEPADLEQKAAQVLSLGTLNKDSQAIRQQYEESPYPRYSHLSFWSEPQPYSHRSEKLYYAEKDLGALESTPLEVLVAGCGTGNQALRLAGSIKNINITAIDLSRQSIAFGERMRTAYGISNVQFYQADILELPKVFKANQQRFHVIECVGVLHHLVDMHAGLAALNELLVPGGVLHLALYSGSARSRISELRILNDKLGIKPRPEHIRLFRRQLFNSEMDTRLQQILFARDFYNLNGCRDLLFNSQETCLAIPQIKSLLDSQNLEFLGFQFDSGDAERKFREMFPADSAHLNLEYWHQFERLHPDTFWHMYQFYCRKPEQVFTQPATGQY
jgi:2-polyprenyl-3-methyl-5-hydroxy-6-metoxy-1,4-benzoquinol methylase